MAQLKEKIMRFWLTQSAREQKFLFIWASLLLCALLYFLVFAPLTQRMARLEKSLPAQEALLFAMRAYATPAASATAAGVASGDLRSALFDSLEKQAVFADLRSLSTERAELRFAEMPTQQAIDVLEKLRADSGARVATLSIKRGKSLGLVLIVVEMERSA